MILLIIFVTFLSSANKEPVSMMASMSSREACEYRATEVKTLIEKNGSVDGYYITCVTVPTKT